MSQTLTKNSRKFNAETIQNYSRKDCYESKPPYIKACSDIEYKKMPADGIPNKVNVFQLRSIPAPNQLSRWSTELARIHRMATTVHYVQCNVGNLSYEDIRDLQLLQKSSEYQIAVSQELSWFNSPPMLPYSIKPENAPSNESIAEFKSLLWDYPANLDVTDHNIAMSPNTLGNLCCKRWVSSDLILFFQALINNNSLGSCKVVYINFVRDFDTLVVDLKASNPLHEKLIFLINVKIKGAGVTTLGSDLNPGNHWTMGVYDATKNEFIYGDSYGQKMPDGLLHIILNIIESVYEPETEATYSYCHNPDVHSRTRVCDDGCASNYPLQTCASICGVVTLIMASIAAKDWDFFVLIAKTVGDDCTNLYLKYPTKYAKYLRLVLMSWIVSGDINISNIVPKKQDLDVEDSDDDEDIIRSSVNINIDDEEKDVNKQEVPDPVGNDLTNRDGSNVEKSCAGSNESLDLESFKCPECTVTFSRKGSLNRHLKAKHTSALNEGNSVCLQCEFKCRRITDLRKHLSEKHGMDFANEVLNFDSVKAFVEWKTEYEENVNCQYIIKSGALKNKLGNKVTYWKCNRSGVYKSVRQGRRRIKGSGTRKISKNCTSTMKVTYNVDKSVTVEAELTHYGHKKELRHVSLSHRVRKELAAKLHRGMSKGKILDEIRDQVCGISVQRLHLTSKKDLENISRSFAVDSIQRSHNDQESVAAWLEEWEGQSQNPILFKKLQGEPCEEFKEEDFMIVMHTEFQQHMLQKFGNNGVLLDSTHGTNEYDFSLTTMLVIDEYGEGQPAGWCISNHETFEFMKKFFECIRDKSGLIQPPWIMSDMAPQYYNAFSKVNDCNPKQLWCAWHIDKAWREELGKKVKNVPTEADVYKRLKYLGEITDTNTFDDYAGNLVKSLLSSSNTKTFGDYFSDHWIPKKEQWAGCHRIGTGINTNMRLEAFHRVFKYNYLHGKHNRRMDKCLLSLVRYNRDKIFERLIKETKGKNTFEKNLIYKRHLSSIELKTDGIVEKECEGKKSWDVPSASCTSKTYQVNMLAEQCDKVSCHLDCSECGACSHIYTCTCFDFVSKNIPCKHIHLIRRYVGVESKNSGHDVIDNLDFSAGDGPQSETISFIKGSEPLDFEKLKSKVLRNLNELIGDVSNAVLSQEDALKNLDQQIFAAKGTFSALSSNKPMEFDVMKRVHHNQNTVRQPKFFSTKRKQKKSKVRLAKPTEEEKLKFQEDWIGHEFDNSESNEELLAEKEKKVEDASKCALTLKQKKILRLLGIERSLPFDENLVINEGYPLPEIIDVTDTDMDSVKGLFSSKAWVKVLSEILRVTQSWWCLECEQSKFSDMISCDQCELWFHWNCVSKSADIPGESHSWYCKRCNSKRHKEDL